MSALSRKRDLSYPEPPVWKVFAISADDAETDDQDTV